MVSTDLFVFVNSAIQTLHMYLYICVFCILLCKLLLCIYYSVYHNKLAHK
jgi:hypothetical protein